jgi:hypothetical protein
MPKSNKLVPGTYTLFYGVNDGDNPPEFTEFFYDGSLLVHNGYAHIPKDNTTWTYNLLLKGYRFVDSAEQKEFDEIAQVAI